MECAVNHHSIIKCIEKVAANARDLQGSPLALCLVEEGIWVRALELTSPRL